MPGIFPVAGVAAEDAVNTILDLTVTAGCVDLWYSTGRCKPAFDAKAANAQLSELLNIITCGNGSYDCHVNNNAVTAIRNMLGGNAVFLGAITDFINAPPGSVHPENEVLTRTWDNEFQIVNDHACLSMSCALFADVNLSASSAGDIPGGGIEAAQQDGSITGLVSINGGPATSALLSSSQAFSYGTASVQQPRAVTRGILQFVIPPGEVARLSFTGVLVTTQDDFAQNSAYRTVMNGFAWYHWHYQ